MACRLAIAISGAVSLGSYEAGVVFEVIRAIGQHNQDSPEDQHITIDVLTGASAGGMTAALLAQKLLYDRDALEDRDAQEGDESEKKNALYRAWVQDIDITGLLDNRLGDNPKQSIFSSNRVEQIARDLILKRYDDMSPQNRHPAAADTIFLGMTLANLNGIDYRVPTFQNADLDENSGEFIHTCYQDSFIRKISDTTDDKTFWEEVVLAACACRAFPFAFRPRRMSRKYKEEQEEKKPDYEAKGAAPFAHPEEFFNFADGGIFNNNPLGMAKTLVNKIDTAPLDYETRFYLYISPNSRDSTRNKTYNSDQATLPETGLALLKAIFNQSRYQDWIATDKINKRIEELDRKASGLCKMFETMAGTNSADDIQALDRAAEVLLKHTYDGKDHRLKKEAFHRLEEQYREEVAILRQHQKDAPHIIDSWIKMVHALETMAHLEDKDHMTIYTLTASEFELAGEGLSAFLGFLDKQYREFDYSVGRRKAREFLEHLQRLNKSGIQPGAHGHLPLHAFTFPAPLQLPSEDFSGVKLQDVKLDIRKDLHEHICKRLQKVLKPQEARFELTKESLDDLKQAGIPENIVEALRPMIGQEIEGNKKFWKAVKKQLDSDDMKKYGDHIAKYGLKQMGVDISWFARSFIVGWARKEIGKLMDIELED